MRSRFALVLALLAWPSLLPAATLLVYVEETTDRTLLPGEHPVRDAVLGALFDRGHIVFDPGESVVTDIDWTDGLSASLLAFATEGDAAFILVARAESRTTSREKGRPLVEISMRYHIMSVSQAGAQTGSASATFTVSNRGTEDEMDFAAVVREAGEAMATRVDAVLPASERPPPER